MKNKVFAITILVLAFTSLCLKGQITTPSAEITGASGNNNVGIGFTSTPIAPLTIARGDNTFGSYNRVSIAFTYYNTGSYRHFIATRHEANRPDYNAIEFYTCDGTSNGTFPNNAVHGLTIMNGKVGIATGEGVNPQNALDVNGTIRAKKVMVETGWADFVFKNDYKLMSLSDLENFIQQNGHLPEIPTESQVKKDGVDLGEMNARLLQKVEELTLYIIEIDKELKELKKDK